MNRVGVDTNVVVSFLTDRDPEQQARSAALIRDATTGKIRLVLPQAVMLETVYVLRNLYALAPARVARSLEDFTSLPGVATSSEIDWPAVWRLWPRRVPDFGDACMAASARAGAFGSLATFDATFARKATRLGIPSYW